MNLSIIKKKQALTDFKSKYMSDNCLILVNFQPKTKSRQLRKVTPSVSWQYSHRMEAFHLLALTLFFQNTKSHRHFNYFVGFFSDKIENRVKYLPYHRVKFLTSHSDLLIKSYNFHSDTKGKFKLYHTL